MARVSRQMEISSRIPWPSIGNLPTHNKNRRHRHALEDCAAVARCSVFNRGGSGEGLRLTKSFGPIALNLTPKSRGKSRIGFGTKGAIVAFRESQDFGRPGRPNMIANPSHFACGPINFKLR